MKVCNHPELFERREARSPLYLNCNEYIIPKLIYEDGMLHKAIPSVNHLLYNKFSILAIEWMFKSLFSENKENESVSTRCDSFFSFLRFVDISFQELKNMLLKGVLYL